MKIQAVYCRIDGRVQGVGYRYFAQSRAQALGVTGWVRNCPEGTVEVEAEGTEATLKAFLKDLAQGPSFAHVTRMTAEWRSLTQGFSGFDIR